jgi:alpha-glucosidase
VGEKHPWAREREMLRGSAWRGYGHLPELDLGSTRVREALFGTDGVIARWTRRGATGWRLDCANDLGPDVCGLAARAAREAGVRDGVIGEVMAYPVGWAGDHGLDGVMNYWVRSAVLGVATGASPAAQAQHALDRLAAEMPPAALRASWNVLSSHDTPRLATVLDGSAARIRLALALAFAYPGVPMIYYGEEIGMRGGADPQNRGEMIWDAARWDASRLGLVRRLSSLRREEPALREGRYVSLAQPGADVVAFARVTDRPADTIVCVANAAAQPRRVRLFVALPWMLDGLPLTDLLDEKRTLSWSQGCLDLPLDPHGVMWLKPKDAHPSGYRFFK